MITAQLPYKIKTVFLKNKNSSHSSISPAIEIGSTTLQQDIWVISLNSESLFSISFRLHLQFQLYQQSVVNVLYRYGLRVRTSLFINLYNDYLIVKIRKTIHSYVGTNCDYCVVRTRLGKLRPMCFTLPTMTTTRHMVSHEQPYEVSSGRWLQANGMGLVAKTTKCVRLGGVILIVQYVFL